MIVGDLKSLSIRGITLIATKSNLHYRICKFVFNVLLNVRLTNCSSVPLQLLLPAYGVPNIRTSLQPESRTKEALTGATKGPYGKHQWDVKLVDLMSKDFIIVSSQNSICKRFLIACSLLISRSFWSL